LYWKPERQPFKALLLGGVSVARHLTTRLPHSAVYALAYPSAIAAFMLFVWPYKVMKQVTSLKAPAEELPMKQYASFPFRVCVNDQLDRFSAPIENRYTKSDVHKWLERAGLNSPQVAKAYGWVATGKKS
jgi:hypothetical protein